MGLHFNCRVTRGGKGYEVYLEPFPAEASTQLFPVVHCRSLKLTWLNVVQIYFIMLQSCQACSENVAKHSSHSESLSVAFTCFITEMRFIARFANNSLKTTAGAAMLEAGSFCHFALVVSPLRTHLWRYITNFSYSRFRALADVVSCVVWCFDTNSHINCSAAIAAHAVVLTETISYAYLGI